MKRYLTITIILCLILSTGVGCSSKHKAPEGVRQSFYNDMVKCLELTEKTLENKNTKYIGEIEEIIKKHTADNFFKVVHGLEEIDEAAKNDYGLSEKESEILTEIFSICFSLSQYMQRYFKGYYDVDKLIDIEIIGGETLLRSIQEAISIMELDYEFKI